MCSLRIQIQLEAGLINTNIKNRMVFLSVLIFLTNTILTIYIRQFMYNYSFSIISSLALTNVKWTIKRDLHSKRPCFWWTCRVHLLYLVLVFHSLYSCSSWNSFANSSRIKLLYCNKKYLKINNKAYVTLI